MLACELRDAARRIVDLLDEVGILAAVRQFRRASDDERVIAAARLGHAGAALVEKGERLDAGERIVMESLHLDSLTSSDYWRTLLESSSDAKRTNAELVHLYSRVMFASTHLPNLLKLLDTIESPASRTRDERESEQMSPGETPLVIRLTDAGEQASDPDRVARAIDGIDMLYSACASMAGATTTALSLMRIDGRATRDVHFDGEPDVLAAVASVIGSIPDALRRSGDDPRPNIDTLVASLPVFEALEHWIGGAELDESEIEDIRETLHQGVVLTMESGTLLREKRSIREPNPSSIEQNRAATRYAEGEESGKAADDEHYRRYLRERDLLISGEGAGGDDAVERRRQEAVRSLLDSLGRTRSATQPT